MSTLSGIYAALSGAYSTSNSYQQQMSAINNQSSSSGTSSSSSSTSSSQDQVNLSPAAQAAQQLQAYGQIASLGAQFNSLMTGLVGTSLSNPLGATSSNSAVGTVTTNTDLNYSINVTQLAHAQALTSSSVKDVNGAAVGNTGTTVVGTGALTISIGTYDATSKTFTDNGNPITVNVGASYGNGTTGTLNDIVNAIKNSGTGLSASAVSDGSGGYKLQVSANNGGSAQAFKITVAPTDGSDPATTPTQGLAQFAFDPAATAGAGKNMTQTQAAQDAHYTVNGTSYASNTNLNVPVAPNININLVSTGALTVNVPQAPTQLTTNAQNLVSYYNAMLQAINQFAAPGGPLNGHADIATMMRMDLTQTAVRSFQTGGDNTALGDLGITIQSDGSLQLNTTQLTQAYSNDSSSARMVMTLASLHLSNVVNNYIGGGGLVDARVQSLQNQMQVYNLQNQQQKNYTNTSDLSALNNPDLGLT